MRDEDQYDNLGASGTVRGVRTFYWDDYAGHGLSGQWGGIWLPKTNTAVCRRSTNPRNYYTPSKVDEPHEVVDIDCSCSFYSYWRIPDHQLAEATVFGVVDGFGKVLIGDLGFRSEKARLLGVTLNPKADKERRRDFRSSRAYFREYYQVPVLPSLEALLAEFPLHGMPTSGAT